MSLKWKMSSSWWRMSSFLKTSAEKMPYARPMSSESVVKHAEEKKDADGQKEIDAELARIKQYCQVVRVITHTQIRKVKIGQKRAHMMEVQVKFS